MVLEALNNRDDLQYTSLDLLDQKFSAKLVTLHLEKLTCLHLSWTDEPAEVWNQFFSEIRNNEKVQLKKLVINEKEPHPRRGIDMELIVAALCQIEEVGLPGCFSIYNDLFTKLVETMAESPQGNMKLKRLYIFLVYWDGVKDSDWQEESNLAKALCKLEVLSTTKKRNLTPRQENAIYRRIIDSQESKLKTLDLRRTSTNIDDVEAELQAEAVVNLVEYRNTVNHEQARTILDKIFFSENIKLKILLLVVRDNVRGTFTYCPKKMEKVKVKLQKLKVFNGV